MWPDLPGADSFAGPTCHTAQWDDTIDLAGKRVAVIGAGASGFQLVPAIAAEAGHVDVYQRTAQWMAPSPRYHEKVGPGVGWAMRHLPSYARWYRLFLAWHVSDGARGGSTADPDWTGDPRSVSELNDISRQIFTAWLEQQVEDAALLEKVIPDYPTFGKRLLQDNGTWLRTLQRDDVDLIRDTIDHIDADGVTTVDGVHRPADVLVWATGFRVSEMLWPMRIVGADGRTIDEVWDGKPSAYLGITVSGFPNFFVMYGPGTNMVHGGSVINMSECQITYIMGCLDRLAAGPARTMDVRPEVQDDYQRRFHDEMSANRLGAPRRALVLQARRRPGLHRPPVPLDRLLDLDPGAAWRGLHLHRRAPVHVRSTPTSRSSPPGDDRRGPVSGPRPAGTRSAR